MTSDVSNRSMVPYHGAPTGNPSQAQKSVPVAVFQITQVYVTGGIAIASTSYVVLSGPSFNQVADQTSNARYASQQLPPPRPPPDLLRLPPPEAKPSEFRRQPPPDSRPPPEARPPESGGQLPPDLGRETQPMSGRPLLQPRNEDPALPSQSSNDEQKPSGTSQLPSQGSKATPQPNHLQSNAPSLPSLMKQGNDSPLVPSNVRNDQNPMTKGTQGTPPPPLAGLPKEKLGVILQQVALASFLFKTQQQSGQSSTSFLPILQIMQKYGDISQKLSSQLAQIEQKISQGGANSTQQKNELMTQLSNILKQLNEMQKQLPQDLNKAVMQQEKTALNNPLLQAMQTLKARSETLLNQMQNPMEAGASKSNQQTAPRSIPGETLQNPVLDGSKKEQSLGLKLNPQVGSPSPLSVPADKASIPVPITGVPLNVSGQQVIDKSTHLPPQLIQTSADLHALAAKLQKKELIAPLSIAIIYSLDKERNSNAISPFKTESKENKEGSRDGALMSQEDVFQEMVLIPREPLFVEIPSSDENAALPDFFIAVHPVTNAQYANWLSEMHAQNAIVLSKNGIILNRNNHILCKLHSVEPTSQIETVVSHGQLVFRPLKGTDEHPVVQVSTLGAESYSASYNFRLPSEMEWEKAAGMPCSLKNEEMDYFLYGNGNNEMDLSWANFRDELQEYADNRTTPVGFYNGQTVFTKQGKNYQSKKAISPFGCYDMSGNVRQWTSDEKKENRIAKGGSYNSPAEELLIASSKLLDPQACYADTGFRVVLDIL